MNTRPDIAPRTVGDARADLIGLDATPDRLHGVPALGPVDIRRANAGLSKAERVALDITDDDIRRAPSRLRLTPGGGPQR